MHEKQKNYFYMCLFFLVRLLTASPCLLGTWEEYQCQHRRWCEPSTQCSRRTRDKTQPPTRRCGKGAQWRAQPRRTLPPASLHRCQCPWKNIPQRDVMFFVFLSHLKSPLGVHKYLISINKYLVGHVCLGYCTALLRWRRDSECVSTVLCRAHRVSETLKVWMFVGRAAAALWWVLEVVLRLRGGWTQLQTAESV